MLFLRTIAEACTDPEILKVILYLRLIMKYVFMGIPIILIIMITFDFIRNVIANNEDTMKQNQKVAIKRVIYCIALFFVYPIVNVIFGLTGLVDLGGLKFVSCWNNASDIDRINELSKTITFNGNGGKVIGDSTKVCGGETSCIVDSLPKSSRKSHTFIGWSTSPSCSNIFNGTSIKIISDVTYYACWQENVYGVVDIASSAVTANTKLATEKYGGTNYLVISNASSFEKYTYSSRFYQAANTSKWGDSCLGFAQVYTNAIKTNYFPIIDNQPGLVKGNSPTLDGISFKEITNDNKSIILKEIVKSVNDLKPVVLQVNGNKVGTSRHYVTVVGYKSYLSSTGGDVEESDLLILDVWDAKIEQMNGKGSGTRFMITGKDRGSKYGYQIYAIK